MIYDFTENYNEELAQYVDGLFTQDKSDKLSRQYRLEASDSLIETYVKHTGLRPPSAQLGRLATLILRDELADDTPWKSRQEDAPFLSDTQLYRRRQNEASDKLAEEFGTDGLNYRLPVRKAR